MYDRLVKRPFVSLVVFVFSIIAALAILLIIGISILYVLILAITNYLLGREDSLSKAMSKVSEEIENKL